MIDAVSTVYLTGDLIVVIVINMPTAFTAYRKIVYSILLLFRIAFCITDRIIRPHHGLPPYCSFLSIADPLLFAAVPMRIISWPCHLPVHSKPHLSHSEPSYLCHCKTAYCFTMPSLITEFHRNTIAARRITNLCHSFLGPSLLFLRSSTPFRLTSAQFPDLLLCSLTAHLVSTPRPGRSYLNYAFAPQVLAMLFHSPA